MLRRLNCHPFMALSCYDPWYIHPLPSSHTLTTHPKPTPPSPMFSHHAQHQQRHHRTHHRDHYEETTATDSSHHHPSAGDGAIHDQEGSVLLFGPGPSTISNPSTAAIQGGRTRDDSTGSQHSLEWHGESFPVVQQDEGDDEPGQSDWTIVAGLSQQHTPTRKSSHQDSEDHASCVPSPSDSIFRALPVVREASTINSAPLHHRPHQNGSDTSSTHSPAMTHSLFPSHDGNGFFLPPSHPGRVQHSNQQQQQQQLQVHGQGGMSGSLVISEGPSIYASAADLDGESNLYSTPSEEDLDDLPLEEEDDLLAAPSQHSSSSSFRSRSSSHQRRFPLRTGRRPRNLSTDSGGGAEFSSSSTSGRLLDISYQSGSSWQLTEAALSSLPATPVSVSVSVAAGVGEVRGVDTRNIVPLLRRVASVESATFTSDSSEDESFGDGSGGLKAPSKQQQRSQLRKEKCKAASVSRRQHLQQQQQQGGGHVLSATIPAADGTVKLKKGLYLEQDLMELDSDEELLSSTPHAMSAGLALPSFKSYYRNRIHTARKVASSSLYPSPPPETSQKSRTSGSQTGSNAVKRRHRQAGGTGDSQKRSSTNGSNIGRTGTAVTSTSAAATALRKAKMTENWDTTKDVTKEVFLGRFLEKVMDIEPETLEMISTSATKKSLQSDFHAIATSTGQSLINLGRKDQVRFYLPDELEQDEEDLEGNLTETEGRSSSTSSLEPPQQQQQQHRHHQVSPVIWVKAESNPAVRAPRGLPVASLAHRAHSLSDLVSYNNGGRISDLDSAEGHSTSSISSNFFNSSNMARHLASTASGAGIPVLRRRTNSFTSSIGYLSDARSRDGQSRKGAMQKRKEGNLEVEEGGHRHQKNQNQDSENQNLNPWGGDFEGLEAAMSYWRRILRSMRGY